MCEKPDLSLPTKVTLELVEKRGRGYYGRVFPYGTHNLEAALLELLDKVPGLRAATAPAADTDHADRSEQLMQGEFMLKYLGNR